MAIQSHMLSAQQQAMVALWDSHLESEFATHSVPDTMDSMTEHPVNINVPVLTGGVGYVEVQDYYARHVIPKNPADSHLELISRTIGADRIVDELLLTFTHTTEMDWMLPGVPPTGRRVLVPLVAVVEFRDGLIDSEHVYWDQASVLVQLGLLDPVDLPVAGVECAHKLLSPASISSKFLIQRRGGARGPHG